MRLGPSAPLQFSETIYPLDSRANPTAKALDHNLPKNTTTLLSIVICTRNRSELLSSALNSLAQQINANRTVEVIVVDNGSSDDTKTVVVNGQSQFPVLKRIFEPRIGLSHARNRGYEEAAGDYVGYLDDDAEAPAEWLAVALEIIENEKPAAFGGPYYPLYHSPKPRWFKDEYASRSLSQEPRVLKEREYLSGGNMFFRRDILKNLGGFNPDFGMTGATIAYGEETDLLNRLREKFPGEKIYYDPRLYILHSVPERKMDLRWLVRQRWQNGRYWQRLQVRVRPNITISDRIRAGVYFLQTAVILFAKTTAGWIVRNRQRYPYWQNYIYESAFPHLARLGQLYEIIFHRKKSSP